MIPIREVIGALGFLTNAVGNELVGRLRWYGWPVRLASNFLWLAYGWHDMSTSVAFNAAWFSVVNVRYWIAWRRNAMEKKYTREELVEMCKRIDYDLECRACASRFFDGERVRACDDGCKTVRPVWIAGE